MSFLGFRQGLAIPFLLAIIITPSEKYLSFWKLFFLLLLHHIRLHILYYVQFPKMNFVLLALVQCKMAFFKRAWYKVKLLPQFSPFRPNLTLIRALKAVAPFMGRKINIMQFLHAFFTLTFCIKSERIYLVTLLF